MKKLISIICAFATLLMVPALNLSGQNQVQVRGKVTDNAGVPVIGAGMFRAATNPWVRLLILTVTTSFQFRPMLHLWSPVLDIRP